MADTSCSNHTCGLTKLSIVPKELSFKMSGLLPSNSQCGLRYRTSILSFIFLGLMLDTSGVQETLSMEVAAPSTHLHDFFRLIEDPTDEFLL